MEISEKSFRPLLGLFDRTVCLLLLKQGVKLKIVFLYLTLVVTFLLAGPTLCYIFLSVVLINATKREASKIRSIFVNNYNLNHILGRNGWSSGKALFISKYSGKTCRLIPFPTGRINLAVLRDGRYKGVL